MKWMLGVVLALGLTGCSWQDDVKVRGEGAVVEQQHPLGREVTRVLAGVPANLYLVAGESHTLRVRGRHSGIRESRASRGFFRFQPMPTRCSLNPDP